MKMPFGKHIGKELDKVPRGYLRWLSRLPDLREPLKSAVSRVLAGEPVEDEETPQSLEARALAVVKPYEPPPKLRLWKPGQGETERFP